jgi:dihydroorotate dehydrogenase (fumarate)
MVKLDTTFLGIKLKNPLIAASSGLTNSFNKIRELEEAGIGAVVLKSIFEEQIRNQVESLISRDPINISYPEAEDYIRNYLRNNSITRHLKLLEELKKQSGIPVIASVNCISAEEWTTFSHDFQEAGADALELNIFSIPVNRNMKQGTTEQLYYEILSKVVAKVKIPVSVKLSSHLNNIVGMADKLRVNGASGVVLFNRFYEPDINLEKLELTGSDVLSSSTDYRKTLRWVGLVSSLVPGFDIAASTGIHCGNTVVKMILAGAKVTQLCSTLYLNGPEVINQIINDLKRFMEKWNFRNPDDFRGRLSYKNIPNPMMYERVQFMKYYSDHNRLPD